MIDYKIFYHDLSYSSTDTQQADVYIDLKLRESSSLINKEWAQGSLKKKPGHTLKFFYVGLFWGVGRNGNGSIQVIEKLAGINFL